MYQTEKWTMKNFLVLSLTLLLGTLSVAAQWKPVGDRIRTRWAEQIDVNNVLPEYPRPIMEREEWMNLNGLWDYAVQPIGTSAPSSYRDKILVPFAIESSLSGVGRQLGEENELWYRRVFHIPSAWKGQRVLLHFGAVDWKAEVGATPWATSFYNGGAGGFEVSSVSLKAEKSIPLTEKFSLPLSVQASCNPATEDFYIVLGLHL